MSATLMPRRYRFTVAYFYMNENLITPVYDMRFTSAEEVMYSSDSVCLCVCVKTSKKSYERILMKFCREVERGPRKNRLDFVGDPMNHFH